jgi:hypothetical protein
MRNYLCAALYVVCVTWCKLSEERVGRQCEPKWLGITLIESKSCHSFPVWHRGTTSLRPGCHLT